MYEFRPMYYPSGEIMPENIAGPVRAGRLAEYEEAGRYFRITQKLFEFSNGNDRRQNEQNELHRASHGKRSK